MGHAVRAGAVVSALERLTPLAVTVVAPCERRVWPPALSACTREWIHDSCDAGVLQSDDVTVDLAASGRRLEAWLRDREAIAEREAARLAGRCDVVVGDVPSTAFDAAFRAQIPSVAVANFSWDWIYGELGFAEAAAASAESYAKASLLVEASPNGPMPAFARRLAVGLIARTPSARREETRAALGVEERQSLVLLAFQPASAPALVLPPARAGRVFAAPPGFPGVGSRADFRALPGEVSFPDALAAGDVVVGKPGYGLLGDVDASGVRFLYVPRPGFPENAVLEAHLARRPGTASLPPSLLASGRWEDRLVELEEGTRPDAVDAGGAQRAAAAILEVGRKQAFTGETGRIK